MSRFNYFNLKYAVKEHDKIIEISGGSPGIREEGLLESVIIHVQNDVYYPNLTDKLTHIVFSIAMNHAFADGNKRSSIGLAAYFLEINGQAAIIGKFIIEMENIVLWVAQKRISKDFLQEIIASLIENGELTEEVKLKLLSSLEKE